MYKNYLKIAIRNLLKQKSFTFINVSGLAMGIACFMLILLYVKFEISYDRFFEKADQIYRVAIERKYPDRVRLWGRTAFPIARTFQNEYPEILQGTRLVANNNSVLITYGNKNIYNNRVIFADPNFFSVFSIPLIDGDPKTVLAKPNSAVITQESALMLFGEKDVMGKTFTIFNADYTVTGISERVPDNCHFHYDFLLSFITQQDFNGNEWINNWGAFTYIALEENTDAEALEAKFPDMVEKYIAPEILDEVKVPLEEFIKSGNGYRYFLQPLKDIHLRSHLEQEIEGNSNITYVYLFFVISIFIILIACINFMNLTTARSANRAKEVGIRKSVGSTRGQIIMQFLLESILLSFMGLLIAIVLVTVLLPFFNNLANKSLELNYFSNIHVVTGFFGFILSVGVVAGSYPAFFLSSFRPVDVLSGRQKRKSRNSSLRNILVTFQFTISIILIVSTLVVDQQIRYMLNKDLGFDKEHVIGIKNANILNPHIAAFKQSLLSNANVVSASGSFNYPARAFDGNVHRPVGTSDERAVSLSQIFADYDYVKTLGMEIVAGRNFSQEFPTDRQFTYVVNETAVKVLGLTDPVGARITDHQNIFTIIGVLKDFNFKSLHTKISPVVYVGVPDNNANYVSVRIGSNDIFNTLTFLKTIWHDFTDGQPFEFFFLEDDLETLYSAEQNTKKLAGIFSGIAIFIGCLGLFGLAAYTAEQRTKELGVRKVMGASILKIVVLLVKDFTKLVVIAFFIGSPIAYFGLTAWLENFAYSISLSPASFLISGILALGIALLTVSYQAVKAAFRNPVDSLRYE